MEILVLKDWWNVLKEITGYQSLVDRFFNRLINDEELEIMNGWDMEELDVIKDCENYYRDVELPRSQEQLREFKKEMVNDETIECRLEYLRKKKQVLEKSILKANEHDRGMRQRFYSPVQPLAWLRLAIMELWNLPKLERELKRVLFEIRLKENREEIKEGWITPEMIQQARQYPFNELTQVNRTGFTKCPYHNEAIASFYIKNNWGYCFGCGKSADTIQYLMDTKGLNFIESVKALQ